MNRLSAVSLSLSLGALLLFVPGCGNGLSSVKGIVSLDGVPIKAAEDVRGTVYFYPEGGGATASGRLDDNGEYHLMTGSKKGIAPGNYRVAISASRLVRRGEFDLPIASPISPPYYANPTLNGLQVTVESGSNEFDFDLESEKLVRSKIRR